MQFLQPFFLPALAALSVPILIHLFFRLRTKRVELGTIRFLRVVLEENARRRKVMRWVLLGLRMAFVALLVGLFARPFVTAQAKSGEKQLVVLLIDRSATMQLKDDKARLIDQAVADAKKLIQESGSAARVEIAFFDHAVHPLTDNAATTGDWAAQLAASDAVYGATNYGVAIEWARDVLIKAPDGTKTLHLFTDMQRSGLDWTEVAPLPADVAVHLHDLGRSVVNNIAVSEVRVPRVWVRPGEPASLRASITYGGAFALDDVAVVMEVGKAPLSLMAKSNTHRVDSTKLMDRVTKRERVKLEPGATITLDFDLPALSEGRWQGRVFVEYDDDLAFDNQRHFAIAAAAPYRVLVVNGGDSSAPILSETYFLEMALRLAAPGESFNGSPFNTELIQYGETDKDDLPSLNNFDAVVLANVGDVRSTDAAQLASFVKAGGGLLVFTGDQVTAKSAAPLIQAGLGVGEIGEPHVTRDLPWRLASWDDKHPIFQPLSDPQYGDLRRLMFAAYTPINPSSDAKVLAEFNTHGAAVIERPVGQGTLLWVTTPCGRDWSDWCGSRLFLPMVHQLLGYEVGLSAGGRIRSQSIDITDKQAISESDQKTAPRSQSPQSAEVSLVPGVNHFERYSDVINTSPRESETERCSREDFENRFAMRFVDDESSSDTAAALSNVEIRQDELWPWLACLLMAVLLLESFVGNRTTA